MDAPQWSQQVISTLARPMEEQENTTQTNNNNNNSTISRSIPTTQQETPSLERRTRPQKDQNINCPRCNSTNTKFCYYNNYSLTQPRFFCKTCRRYWTQGGSLRSVPMGGGSRKNKRSSSSSSFSSPPPQTPRPLPLPVPLPLPLPLSVPSSTQNPNIKYLEVGQDLNLAFPMQGLFHPHHNMDQQLPKIEGNDNKNQNYVLPFNMNNNNNNTTTTPTTATNTGQLSALELLRSGIASRGNNLNPFVPLPMPDANTIYQSGSYPNMQEFKTSMNFFSSPNHENNNNNNNNDNDSNNNNGARLLFPFADMNKLATNNNHDEIEHDHDQSKGNSESDHNHSGYWSGMLGGGPW